MGVNKLGMKQIELSCETVTPLFMSGADGMTPELRAPSIKALVRYWWRAANAHMEMKTLIDTEKKIFGGTGEDNKKNEYGKSKVAIRVKQNISDRDISDSLYNQDIGFKLVTNKVGNQYKVPIEYKGVCYMLYSTILPNKERKYIKPDTPFSIGLTFRDKDKEAINEFLKGFIYLEYFGGLGSRSRRGAGSFRITDINGDTEYIQDDIKAHITMNGINNDEKFKNRIEELSEGLKETTNTSYSMLKGSKVLVFEPSNTWINALEFIGGKFQNFRFHKQSDIYNTPNFGLPLMHKKRGNKCTTMIGAKEYKGDITRRSSPLIFKIIKTEKDKYFPVIIYLNGEFLPSGYKITNKYDRKEGYPPNDNVINDFLNTFDKGDYREVIL